MNNKGQYLLKAVALTGAILGSTSALADCKTPPLVPNIIAKLDGSTDPAKTTNTTICVDVPVQLMDEQALFNIDSLATTDGTPAGAPVALRHMWMLGIANIARAKAFADVDLSNFHIKGVIHGSAVTWALNDAWWQRQVDEDGNQLYPDGNPYKDWIEKIFALQDKGLDIQLEVCGVTLMGKGLHHTATDDDVYLGIHVNQGAIGRIIDLQQNGYTYIQEGYIDNDSMYKLLGQEK